MPEERSSTCHDARCSSAHDAGTHTHTHTTIHRYPSFSAPPHPPHACTCGGGGEERREVIEQQRRVRGMQARLQRRRHRQPHGRRGGVGAQRVRGVRRQQRPQQVRRGRTVMRLQPPGEEARTLQRDPDRLQISQTLFVAIASSFLAHKLPLVFWRPGTGQRLGVFIDSPWAQREGGLRRARRAARRATRAAPAAASHARAGAAGARC
jgi:hypothetical protein